MKLVILEDSQAERYDAFLAECPDSLVYQTWRYGQMLRAVLPDAKPRYLLAVDTGGEILGVLPCLLSAPGTFGPILNSLPFFGSHGAVQAKEDSLDVKAFLLHQLDAFAREAGCISSTVITSPFEQHGKFYSRLYRDDLHDERISMVTPLPTNADNIDDTLMAQIHSIRRNDIRRAQRANVTIHESTDEADMDFLSRVHGESMVCVGGTCKPDSFYRALYAAMRPGEDWKLYRAEVNGSTVAVLLVLYWNGTAEYFIPAILPEQRNTQAMALAIFTAMIEAAKSGFHRWNWGGTGLTMDSVYNFKNKWGTREGRYHYYTRLYPEGRKVLSQKPEVLLRAYPWFYVVPFHALNNRKQEVLLEQA